LNAAYAGPEQLVSAANEEPRETPYATPSRGADASAIARGTGVRGVCGRCFLLFFVLGKVLIFIHIPVY
jgi:hypothetical protein